MSSIKIVAHRGLWAGDEELGVPAVQKNSADAFRLATEHRFGIETDFRDLAGKVVISHNPPTVEAMTAEAFAELLTPGQVVFINVKADGLANSLTDLAKHSILGKCERYAFDMSVPDTLGYISADFPILERVSEYENILNSASVIKGVFPERSGIWLDGFHSDWYSALELEGACGAFSRIAVVSPELHGRSHQHVWEMVKKSLMKHQQTDGDSTEFLLCTDKPFEARRYFNEFEVAVPKVL